MVDAVTAQEAWNIAKTELFGGVAPSVSPVLVSIGAQPGAGKTRALDASLKTFYSGQTFVSIIGDDFRKFHPDYKKLCALPDPEVMPRETAELSGWLVRQSLDYASENGYSCVVEGTLRNPETTLGTTRQFAEAGASTHLIVLGVSPAESWSGCLERYINALEKGQAARWTPLEAHNAGLEGTPKTLRAAEADLSVKRISIVDRAGVVHYDNERGVGGQWLKPAGAVGVLENLRGNVANRAAVIERIGLLQERAVRLGVPGTVQDGIKHADVLARGGGKQLHTKADVIAGIKSKAHEMGDKKARQPRSRSIERKTGPKL